jgi:glycosyltransferase involved in cell wall biosynthesis
VLDVDDAIYLPPPSVALPPRVAARTRRRFEATAAAADLVLCGNREIPAHLPHGRYEVLPTSIDTERFAPSAAPPAGKTLGWVGHSDNLPYLEALAEPLRELSRRHPELRLIVVADRPPRIDGVDLEYRPWSLETEVSCFAGMRVGLMPLADTPWARGKCAFKAIQYMALGLAAVASPVGANRDVIEDGETGFLPADDRAWVSVLDRLLHDDALAARVGRAGRRSVEADYSLAVASRRLVEILEGLAVSSSSSAAQSRACLPAS